MFKKFYEYGFRDELEKIAGISKGLKAVGKFIATKPSTSGAVGGAALGFVPSNKPLVVSPYTLSEGFHETPERAKRRQRSYLKKLPTRVLAGALTGSFLGKVSGGIAGELKGAIVAIPKS